MSSSGGHGADGRVDGTRGQRPRENKVATFTAMLCVILVCMTATWVLNSEGFRQAGLETPEALPALPALPSIGKPFPRTTAPNAIVEIQIPPKGRLGRQATRDGWSYGPPEQIYATNGPAPDDGVAMSGSRFHRKGQPFPSTGSVGWYIGRRPDVQVADITFEDRSGDDRRKLIRIRSGTDGSPVADVYLAGGSSRIYLPLGKYRLNLAVGRRWEGIETLFGPYGNYFEIDGMELTDEHTKTTYTRVLGRFGMGAAAESGSAAIRTGADAL